MIPASREHGVDDGDGVACAKSNASIEDSTCCYGSSSASSRNSVASAGLPAKSKSLVALEYARAIRFGVESNPAMSLFDRTVGPSGS
jgi:hypothetical protein